ncbi:MAG TPA: carboxypeptidase-like regulatory domain-containing protein [Candidatus Kapabacteria bacterium]|nr:carboxypeptidase-like regulatory domain-containing protein [Candidatus Kapabacteria bacterium]
MKTIKILFIVLITVQISTNFLYPIIYGSVSGTVIDEETGKGLPGVRVNLTGRMNLYIQANKDGKFAAKLLKPGKYEISFTPPFPYCCLTSGNFVIEPGGKIIFNGVANLAGTIRGKVLYSDTKKPFPGVTITAFGRFAGWAAQKTVEDGSYFLGVDNGKLCPSPNYYIKADCNIPNIAYKVLLGIVVEKGKETNAEDILFDLNDPTGIEGWIKSSIDGKPLNNVTIAVHSEDKKYPASTEEVTMGKVSTNIDGYYYIKNLEPGNYWIHIMPEIDDNWSFAEFSAYCKNKKGIIVTFRKITRVDSMLDIQSFKSLPYGENQ